MMRFLGVEGNRDCYSPDQAKSITVGRLKEILEWFDDELPVYLINDRGYTYGSLSESDIEEHTINNQGELDEEDYEEDDEDLDESYDTSSSTTKKIQDLEVGDIILNSVGDKAEIVEIGEEGSVCTVDQYGNLDTQEFEELEDEDIEVFHHYDEKDMKESCGSVLHIRERAIKEEFSGYDVRSLLDQIEARWGFDTADKMLDWLVEYSDNGNDQLDEYGYYIPEELEFWIGNRKIEDVMRHCLETGVIEESLKNRKSHMHESHRVRKNRLYIKKTHKHNDKISKY